VGDTLHLNAWVRGDGPFLYSWTATVGSLGGSGAQATWDFNGVVPGVYNATVTVSDHNSWFVTCSMQVVAIHRKRGPANGVRDTGRFLLLRGLEPQPGYGLYSYLLLGSAPSDVPTHARYLSFLTGYLKIVRNVAGLERFFDRDQLNVTSLPLDVAQGQEVREEAEWLLNHYDYDRARYILDRFHSDLRSGPYVVSVMKPLAPTSPSGPYLLQDFSTVPPSLATAWIQEFLNQTAQQRLWDEGVAPRFALRLRTLIEVMALGLEDVRSAVGVVIKWVQ
jgi:hypothetical protein